MTKPILRRITKGDKTRQRILEMASALMADRGSDAVSMREISAKLDITKPVLYYYFKNKGLKKHYAKYFQHIRTL